MAFDLQPVLEGELLTLRPLRADDFDALFAAASDPLIWEQHPASDRYTPQVFRAFFEESLASGGALVARDRAAERVIGSSRFYGYDEARRQVGIGWAFPRGPHLGGPSNGGKKQPLD